MTTAGSSTVGRVVGIVGAAGAMGSALCRQFLDAGVVVHACDRAPFVIEGVVAGSLLQVISAADIIILAVQYGAELQIASEHREQLRGKIVVSMTNPLNATLDDVVTPDHDSAAEQLARTLPDSVIVKAFNTIGLGTLNAGGGSDAFLASDDEQAARMVAELVAVLGFRPLYVGGLVLSRTLERMAALIIGVSMRYSFEGPVGWRIVHA
jgi:8-hydroxy-5-deazaflavin:NADPH oxidoreductase